ncbi:AraC family transcriptional regulator [Sphingomonas sp. dw_22]|uniref:AraC family transcriptional regulator n=1 Tax=Sphingomonas sp. dw_22 TaxID=2721175 RepID=UPI001BD3E6CD|nr:AraC family transcriptional regulator [Sphingomonas sp. dw_22]
MDILGDMLTSMQVENALFAHLRFREPWGVAFTTGDEARLIVVGSGASWLLADGFPEPIWVEAGDCLIIKGGAGFTMVSEPGVEIVPCETVFSTINGLTHEYGGNGAVTELVSGRFHFDAAAAEPLLSLLPAISLLKSAEVRGPLMRTTLELVGLETKLDGMGAGLVVRHLVNALFVQALRAWCDTEGGQAPGWLAGLRDARVSRALGALHADIASPWTIAELARHAGMSRSSFAVTFKNVLGETPVEYLTRWRIYRAKLLLQQGIATSDVARRVGYETDAALNRAFNRIEGTGPGAWRRVNRVGPKTGPIC